MRNPMDEIREVIRRLHLARARGDIKEKAFQRLLAQRTMDLYRALVEGALAPGERILKEHHLVEARTRLTESVLREPEQTATSLFLTQRRLLRARSSIRPGQPITADHRDSPIMDELPLAKIRSLRNRFQIRPGEITAGLVMATVGLVFWHWLEVTGVILLGLGLLGPLTAISCQPVGGDLHRAHLKGALQDPHAHEERRKRADPNDSDESEDRGKGHPGQGVR